MENLIFGLQNIGYTIHYTINVLIYHQLTWGFAIGFAASTCIHLVLMSENPKNLTQILTKTPTTSFEKIAQKKSDGTYVQSYTQFEKNYNRVRVLFYSTTLSFFVVVTIALLRY